MTVTGIQSRETLIRWAERIQELLQDRADSHLQAGVAQAVAQLRSERFMLAVLGKAKRGKSTLLNALLGRRDDLVAPIDKLPASSAITRFGVAEREEAVVGFRDGRREAIPFARIREFVTEEFNRENAKGVFEVEVGGPFGGLDRDLVLVDTPGAGSLHEHHDALLHAFIPQSDAVIFLVTARMPLDQDEVDLLKQVKAADIRKVFFVLNRVDESNEADIEAAIAHNSSLLGQVGISVEQIYRISAKRAFNGDMSGSGVLQLLQDIGAFLAANKGRFLAQRFIARICRLVEPVVQAMAVEMANAGKTTKEIEAELSKLLEAKNVMEQDRALTEREFTTAWTRAVDDFERELQTARSDITGVVAKRIAESALLDLKNTAKTLPTFVARTIEERLTPAASSLEQAMRASCTKLQATYPSIDLTKGGSMELRIPKTSSILLIGGLGGGAVAATGAILMSAGATAAAGIAAANAAALAASTIAVPGAIGTLSSLIAAPSLSGLGSFLATLTGSTVTAAAVPVASTPLWVAMAGPVGWTLAGIGALVVPLAWRSSKVKARDQLEEAAKEQIAQLFNRLRTDRVLPLRNMGTSIVEEFRVRLDRQLSQIEASLRRARDRRPDPAEVTRTTHQMNNLEAALSEQTRALSDAG